MLRIGKRDKGKKVFYIVFCAPTSDILLMSFEGVKIKYGETARKFEKLRDANEYKMKISHKRRVCVIYNSSGKWVK